MQNNYSNQKVSYAGFWVRAAAYCIDSFVVFIALLVVRLVVTGVMSAFEGTILAGNILFHYTLIDIVLYVFQVLYFILFTYYTGTTLGKKALNLKVVNADGSEKLRLLDVVYRETIGRFLCGLSVGIGYIFAGVDKEKRGLHDMICDTRVIYGKRIKVYPVYQGRPVPPMQTPPMQVPPMQTPPMEFQQPPRTPQGPYSFVEPVRPQEIQPEAQVEIQPDAHTEQAEKERDS